MWGWHEREYPKDSQVRYGRVWTIEPHTTKHIPVEVEQEVQTWVYDGGVSSEELHVLDLSRTGHQEVVSWDEGTIRSSVKRRVNFWMDELTKWTTYDQTFEDVPSPIQSNQVGTYTILCTVYHKRVINKNLHTDLSKRKRRKRRVAERFRCSVNRLVPFVVALGTFSFLWLWVDNMVVNLSVIL